MKRTELNRVVKQHLELIDCPTVEAAEQRLSSEHWQSFWEVIADRLIAQELAKNPQDQDPNRRDLEDVWQEAWDLIERTYPSITKPLTVAE